MRHNALMERTSKTIPGDLNRLRRESEMLLATVDSLHDDELAAPSLCAGWTRAHVVGHLIGNARGLGRAVGWATSGVEVAMYPSREARDAEIEELATVPPAELKRLLRQAIGDFADAVKGLAVEDLPAPRVTIGPGNISSYELPAFRIMEVIIHHADLGTVWTLEEADQDALEDSITYAINRVGGRDDWPGVTIDTDEGDHAVIGDGAITLRGDRGAILGWLTRGWTTGVRCDQDLPEHPGFA